MPNDLTPKNHNKSEGIVGDTREKHVFATENVDFLFWDDFFQKFCYSFHDFVQDIITSYSLKPQICS